MLSAAEARAATQAANFPGAQPIRALAASHGDSASSRARSPAI